MHIDPLDSISVNIHIKGKGTKEWTFIHNNDFEKFNQLIKTEGHTISRNTPWYVSIFFKLFIIHS